MKRNVTYSVTSEIFSRFPAYTRAVVVARCLANGPTSPALAKLMREEERSVRERINVGDIPNDPQFRPWREAFRWFGVKASDFRPSVEALTRRALRGQLPEISNLVDIGTVICLRHLVPVGAHSLDHDLGDISLRRAVGCEVFWPLDSESGEHPLPGEVILAENNTVLTRRWVWRQASHSLITPETRIVFYNIDILRESSSAEISEMCSDLCELLEEYCEGDISVHFLTATAPVVQLSLET